MKKATWKEVTCTTVLAIIGFVLMNVLCEMWSALYYNTELFDILPHAWYIVIGYSILIASFASPFHVYYNLLK